MRRGLIRTIAALAAAGFLAACMPEVSAQAAQITLSSGSTVETTQVTGTIAKGTTSSLLKLTASEGTYQLKMDSDTDFNGITKLVIGTSATVEVYRGSDAYLHVAKFDSTSSSAAYSAVTTSTSSSSSTSKQTTDVTGTIQKDTTGSMLYLSTSDGDMTIKIDSDCDLTECGTLIAGNKAIASVYRGSDAYMHASKIISGPSSVDLTSLVTVSGTITSSTTNSVIYLSTSSGTYQLKWDTSTNVAITGVLSAGRTVKAVIGKGNDAYMHAIRISDGTKDSTSTSSSTSSSSTSYANTVLISGTVTSDSTQEYIYITNSDGTYKLKYDSDTDFSDCHLVIAGSAVRARIYIGSDSYMHIKQITDLSTSMPDSGTDVDTANAIEVTGTVESGSTQNMIYLDVNDSTMKLKIDTTTDVSECRVIAPDMEITAKIARGDDAYMHAISLSASSTSSSSSSAAKLGDEGMLTGQATTTVTGTVDSDSDEDFLILDVDGDDYKIRLDSGTDRTYCKVLIPDDEVRVEFYRGSDGYLHAAKLVSLASETPGYATSLDESTKVTLEGTVESGTTMNMLYFNLNGGIMKVKIDTTTDCTNCRVLTEDKTVKVVMERGDDAYMHAISITAE